MLDRAQGPSTGESVRKSYIDQLSRIEGAFAILQVGEENFEQLLLIMRDDVSLGVMESVRERLRAILAAGNPEFVSFGEDTTIVLRSKMIEELSEERVLAGGVKVLWNSKTMFSLPSF